MDKSSADAYRRVRVAAAVQSLPSQGEGHIAVGQQGLRNIDVSDHRHEVVYGLQHEPREDLDGVLFEAKDITTQVEIFRARLPVETDLERQKQAITASADNPTLYLYDPEEVASRKPATPHLAPSADDFNAIATAGIQLKVIAPGMASAVAHRLARTYRNSLSFKQQPDDAPIHFRFCEVTLSETRLRLAAHLIDAAVDGHPDMVGTMAETTLAAVIASLP